MMSGGSPNFGSGQGGNNFTGGYPTPSFGGIGQFLSGYFGNSGEPYQKGGEAYLPYFNKGIGYQNPFFQAGSGAIPGYQDWLNQMKDPGAFMNKMMGQYQSSPWAQNMQRMAQQAGTNAASASGMTGSTPFGQQMAQTAGQISSQDMQNWLARALGINTQYGEGLGNEVGWGQHAADQASGMYQQAGENMGNAAYGQAYGENRDRQNEIGGGIGMFQNGLFG